MRLVALKPSVGLWLGRGVAVARPWCETLAWPWCGCGAALVWTWHGRGFALVQPWCARLDLLCDPS
eukprot:365107-Chlamydomonas_euryale.AAC.2